MPGSPDSSNSAPHGTDGIWAPGRHSVRDIQLFGLNIQIDRNETTPASGMPIEISSWFVHRGFALGHPLGKRGSMVAASVASSAYSLSDRYEALIRVSQAIGAHRDPQDLFRAMTTELRRVIQFDGIVVAQYDEASHEIVWHTCQLCDHEGPVSPPCTPAEETITKWVYDRQEPVVIPFLQEETRFAGALSFLRERGFQSVCVLPLTTVHRRIGSVGVASKRADAYSDEEVRFLTLVADQVALAIDDALNFEASRVAQTALQGKN